MMQLAGSVQPCQLIQLVQDIQLLPNRALASVCMETHRVHPVWESACFLPAHADAVSFRSGVRCTSEGANVAGGQCAVLLNARPPWLLVNRVLADSKVEMLQVSGRQHAAL